MKKLLFLSALALLAGCHSDAPAPPATGYDALALAAGHWEWERTTQGFSNDQSPTTVGYTRQLVFTADGQVLIGHDGRVVKTTPYQLDMGTLAGCGAGQLRSPIVVFDNEAGIQAGPRKTYSLNTRSNPTRLSFVGDYACVDGGAYESFHWVAQ